MSGQNNGTGQPYTARCAKCKRYGHKHNDGYEIEATGLRNKLPHRSRAGSGGRMSMTYRYQYRCRQCGHIGWSRHVDVEQRYHRLRLRG